ncbi:hypothetical protein AVEN_162298-1 [Araneus ventricosus]|uniref:Uncharacterized protein n=1 Tax=Araneus ventricosus TaxID=182803 RepID=A0A4Y2TAW5_ARAVE|nr:hypothetical protein AVEN_162298-1 [Araneus ventricosus]
MSMNFLPPHFLDPMIHTGVQFVRLSPPNSTLIILPMSDIRFLMNVFKAYMSNALLFLFFQYAIFVAILLLLEMTAGTLGFIFKDWIKNQAFIVHYREDPDRQNLIDWTQEQWQHEGYFGMDLLKLKHDQVMRTTPSASTKVHIGKGIFSFRHLRVHLCPSGADLDSDKEAADMGPSDLILRPSQLKLLDQQTLKK